MKKLILSLLAITSLLFLPNCSDKSSGGTGAELCGNERDDDGDGFVDCNDADCAAQCEYLELCDNGLDDDGDSFTDCEDQDCLANEACRSVPLELCGNGIDDDLDGFADCHDLECAAGCEYLEICDNGLDDDNDSFTDCDDQDCTFHQACAEPRDERCENGLDDDWDGLLDCADPDCADAEVCLALLPEVCDNGVDDDRDGFIDCNDAECTSVCEYRETCDNGVDDDADGFVDCEDQDCIFSELCVPEEICTNTQDDDGDGRTSCLDPDCFGEAGCGECDPFNRDFSGCGPAEFCYVDAADGYVPRCFGERGYVDEGNACEGPNDCRPDFMCFEGQCVEPCYPDVREGCDCVPFTELTGVENTFFGFCD